MKKRNMLKSVRNKTLIAATAITVSGLLPAGAAFAQGELVAELVVEQGTTVTGKPGQTIDVPVNVYVTPRGTNDTAAVTVTVYFEGHEAKTISFAADEFHVKKSVRLFYTIPSGTTTSTVTPEVKMTSTDQTGTDQVSNGVADKVTINVTHQAVDAKAPTVTATPDRTPDAGDWYNKDVSVSFSATDETDGSDLASVSGPAAVTTDGTHTVTGTAKDKAGNEGTASTVIRLDKTAPSLSSSADAQPNSAGWYNQDINVTFAASDATSGVASKSENVSLTTEGEHVVDGFAQDIAGNRATESKTYKIDKTAPTVTASADRTPDHNGWYNQAVSVLFSAKDDLSGVASESEAAVLGEGTDLSATGSATDFAGNTASATASGINIDLTKPSISSALSGQQNDAGWFNEDVTVTFSGEDGLSGIDTVSDAVVLTEGENKAAEGSVTDKAGNVATEKVEGLNIDTTDPTIKAHAVQTASEHGWFNEDVEVEFTHSDNLSGVVSASNTTTLTEEGTHEVTGSATDAAGNSGTVTESFKIDKTAPSVGYALSKQPNANGWVNEDVVVTFNGDDNLSGIALVSEAVKLTEGTGQTATGSAFDKADNEASVTTAALNIDTTKPEVNLPAGTVFKVGEKVTWSASDALSGLDSAASGTINTSKAGKYTETIKVVDKAGNVTEKTFPYTVEYNYSGVLQPINQNGTSIFKAGSTVPVKFQLKDVNGVLITDANATLTVSKKSNTVTGDVLEAVSTSSATVGNLFRYDASAGQYIFNLNTKGLTVGTYQLSIDLGDGSVPKTVAISLK